MMNTMKIGIILYVYLIWGCGGVGTPEEFKYSASFSEEMYMEDSLQFVEQIKKFIETRSGPYYPSEFDKNTEVLIDTILYSPDTNKVAFFAITKNANSKLLITDAPDGYHFDAHAFLGIRENSKWDVNWFRILNLNNFHTYEAASERIRYKYFVELATLKNKHNQSRFKYNMDDVRFWSGPSWEMINHLSEERFESEGY